MHVLLIPMGSMGDVYPLVGLGIPALRRPRPAGDSERGRGFSRRRASPDRIHSWFGHETWPAVLRRVGDGLRAARQAGSLADALPGAGAGQPTEWDSSFRLPSVKPGVAARCCSRLTWRYRYRVASPGGQHPSVGDAHSFRPVPQRGPTGTARGGSLAPGQGLPRSRRGPGAGRSAEIRGGCESMWAITRRFHPGSPPGESMPDHRRVRGDAISTNPLPPCQWRS
jgi:hypothetical protein